MFNPASTFHIDGDLLGMHVTITIALDATGADASPIPALGRNPLVVDVQNVQTMLLSALNGALIKLQHMDAAFDGASINDIRTGRAAAAQGQPAAVAYDPEKDGKLQ